MNWFSDLIGKITKTETIDFYVSPPLPAGDGAAASRPVPPNTYVTVRCTSLRLPNTRRKVVEKVYGVVHAFAELDARFGGKNEFASATMPSKLAGVDPKNLQNVITMDKLVVGPTPWTGGDLNLQIGLFSVVSENLAGPFLGTLAKLTETVGVGFAATAAPFVETLKFGIEKLTSVAGTVKLEIGADKTLTPPQTGYFALVATEHKALNGKTLSLDPEDKKLLVNGQHYTDKPYLIFAIETSNTRSDWGQIPDLKKSYDAIRQAIIENDRDKAEESLKVFARLAAVSPDLIPVDAKELFGKVNDMMKEAFSAPGTAGAAKLNPPPEFHELGLYERR